ncbi:MAG: uroporphyrinogen decarboxylase family protein [Christensenellales bacterium]
MNSKTIVYNTLDGKEKPRAARDLWLLPWACIYYQKEIDEINRRFPSDFVVIDSKKPASPVENGNPYEKGYYVDKWGAVFQNAHEGIIGEVKQPLIADEEWNDVGKVRIPEELLDFDIEEVNKRIKELYPDKFVLSEVLARPFERLQFLRGTENLFVDLMTEPEGMFAFLSKMHTFYLKLIEKWCKTDVDAIFFMDDWGSQNALLINPELWRRIFKPLYRDYIDLAHRNGKKAFMHSDGNILSIIPDLIELGLDAVNCQIFCIGLDNLAQFRGKITFWGEMDRQHLLVKGSTEDIDEAVQKVYDTLYRDGKAIAQCEFGVGANPRNVFEMYKKWDEITKV